MHDSVGYYVCTGINTFHPFPMKQYNLDMIFYSQIGLAPFYSGTNDHGDEYMSAV